MTIHDNVPCGVNLITIDSFILGHYFGSATQKPSTNTNIKFVLIHALRSITYLAYILEQTRSE